MTLRIRFILVFCLFVCFTYSTTAQTDKAVLEQADAYFSAGKYDKALVLFKRIAKENPTAMVWKYKQGICHFYLNDFQKALLFFSAYLKEKKIESKAYFYTARCLHFNEKYQEALELYKLYLKSVGQNDLMREDTKLLMRQCLTAMRSGLQLSAVIVPMSDSINSSRDEILALTNQRLPENLYFSSNRNGNFEIFYSQFNGNTWSKSLRETRRYNQAGQDKIAVAFADSGYQILLLDQDTLLIDNYDDSHGQSLAVPLDQIFLKDFKAAECYWVEDKMLILSLKKKDSNSGYDLYYSVPDSKGAWTYPEVVEGQLNSKFDERSPFLCADGKTIYFSSNRPESIGGYDIFKSEFDTKKMLWTLPQSLGKIINSAGDDIYFQFLNASNKALFSSVRPNGQGRLDLYTVYFRQNLNEMISNTDSVFTDYFLKEKEPDTQDPLVNNSVSIEENQITYDSASRSYITIPSFLYNDLDGSIESAFQYSYQSLLKAMLENKELKIIITGHGNLSAVEENGLFFTVQHADLLAQKLIGNGVEKDRILLRGCADQYNIARILDAAGQKDSLGYRVNNRLDFEFKNSVYSPLWLKTKRPAIGSDKQSVTAAEYDERLQGISYKLLIYKGVEPLSNDNIDQMPDLSCEKDPINPELRYFVGLTNNFEAILWIKETLDELHLKNIEPKAYLDGFPLKKEEIEIWKEKYPDLIQFLEYLNQ